MEYSKHRFEFFSDGVLAIIMTIMVVEIPVSGISSSNEISGLLKSILIFFVSFFIVGWFWNKHHRLIDALQKITGKIARRNLFFLFCVALLPLFTKWMILNPDDLITVLSYSAVYLIANFFFFILSREVYHQIRLEFPGEIYTKVKKRPGSPVIFLRYIAHCLILIALVVLGILFPKFSMMLYLIKIGKPPALPGDSKSLTFTGVLKVFKFIQNRML